MNKRKLDAVNMDNTSKKQNIEDKTVRYCVMPSLQHISAANIIIKIWSRVDIQCEIEKLFNVCEDVSFFYGISMRKLWQKIEDRVLAVVSQLHVPVLIKKISSDVVHPIGYEILNWLKYQDVKIFSDDCLSRKDLKVTAINYINNLVWTSRGRINYKETAKAILAKGETLSVNYKYKIACVYCLEDEIAVIAPNLINTTLFLQSKRLAMVCYWTSHITGDFSALHEAVYSYGTNLSIYECLFKLLIKHDTNEVAIKYIWDKLSDDEKSRLIVPAIRESSSTDMKCFLLSQMSEKQQQEIFMTDNRDILLCLLGDWLWGDYFLPTVRSVWQFISAYDYLDILNRILIKMEDFHEYINKYNQYKAIFIQVWECALQDIKEYVIVSENKYNNYGIFYRLFYKKNFDIVKSMLFHYTDIQKKKLIFSEQGIATCKHLIKNIQFDLLEMFIQITLFSTKDAEYFRQTLILRKGYNVVIHFIQNKEWDKVEQFMKWAFKSDNEIKKFKTNLLYKIEDIVKSIVAAKNEDDFPKTEYYVEWLHSHNKISVEFKSSEHLESYELIGWSLEGQKRELFEKLIDCFLNDRYRVDRFREYFRKKIEGYDLVMIVDNLMKQPGKLQSLANFVRWCFTAEQETLHNCKNELMINEYIGNIFKKYCDETRLLREIVKWFNPFTETIRFNETFIFSWWRENLLSALDNYMQEQEHNQDEAI